MKPNFGKVGKGNQGRQIDYVWANGEPVTYGYNANGSVTGDTLPGGTLTYIYDKLNRIVKITGIAPVDSFAYDAENKRVYKNEQGVVRNNIYDIFGNLIAEANLGPWAIDYIWVNGEPRARVDNPETEGFAPLAPQVEAYWWYHTDHLGTPQVLTDKNKVVVWKISLDPFGETVTETTPLTLDNLRFPGQYFDRGSGLNYNWHRYYQPKIGRYYQADPLLDQGLMNRWKDPAKWLGVQTELYSYVKNNPVNLVDPNGLTFRSNWNFFWNWVFERGPAFRYYGPNTIEAQEMMASPGAAKMRNAYKKGGCKTVPLGSFGTIEAYFETVPDPTTTAFQVGGFIYTAINNGDGTVTYRIYNRASLHSFFLHIPFIPNKPRGGSFPYGGNIHQVFEWKEVIQ